MAFAAVEEGFREKVPRGAQRAQKCPRTSGESPGTSQERSPGKFRRFLDFAAGDLGFLDFWPLQPWKEDFAKKCLGGRKGPNSAQGLAGSPQGLARNIVRENSGVFLDFAAGDQGFLDFAAVEQGFREKVIRPL